MDLIEKWLEEYLKSTNRFVTESATLENIVGNFTSHALLPNTITEAVLDHDYSVLAMRKYMEGAKDFWMSALAVIRRMTALVAEPIRTFLQNDLRAFKVRRHVLRILCDGWLTVAGRASELGVPPENSRRSAVEVCFASKDQGAVIITRRCLPASRSSQILPQGINGLLRARTSTTNHH